MLSKIAYRSALLPAAMVVWLGLMLALTYLQPIVERNRLMLAWLRLVSSSDEPHRFYQTPLTDATISEFSMLAGRFDALCRVSPGGRAAVCWRAEMARLAAGAADRPLQIGSAHRDSIEQMMLAHVAGDIAYAEGRRAAAVSLWSQHLPPVALIYKAETMLALGDSQSAIDLLTRLPGQRYPQPEGGRLARVLVELGNATLDAGDFANAESYWRRAILQSPERDTYYVGLGRALAGQRRWNEAVAVYQDAILLAPGKAQHYLRLARALVQIGEAEEAILALRRAAELEPDNAAARRLLDQLEQD